MRRPALALVLILAACGGGGSGDDGTTIDAAPPAGRAMMTFSVTNGVRQSPNLNDPLTGTVYGQIFQKEDVTLTGPIDGAVEYGSVEVAGIDLVTAQTSGTFTSTDIPPHMYTFLGFFDVDGNGSADRSPDAGDPVTLPVTNQFEITADQTATVTIEFDLVYN